MRLLKRRLSLVLAAALCLCMTPPHITRAQATAEDAYAADSVIVVVDSGADLFDYSFRSVAGTALPIADIEDLAAGDTYDQQSDVSRTILRLELIPNGNDTVEQAIAALSDDPRVLSVSPNYYYTPCATRNDPYYNGVLADMRTIYDRIDAEAAWELTAGSHDVTVGIIDSGIAAHPDLIGNLGKGHDFYNDTDITDDDPSGHGTHIAGIIGAVGNNGIGVAGVNSTVTLVPLQVTRYPQSHSYDSAAIIKAVTYAHANGIDILNCSFGTTYYDEALYQALSLYDGLIVCSAGNRPADLDEEPYYPAAFDLPNLISVASSTAEDTLAAASGYGTNSVDIAAPGIGIYSTVPSGYAVQGGTSMAAAFVSGAAALLLSYAPHLSAVELKAVLTRSADRCDALTGKLACGGRLNLLSALRYTHKGDVDASGTRTLSDAVRTLYAASGLLPVAEEDVFTMDIDGDGEITVADALSLFYYANGLTPSFL